MEALKRFLVVDQDEEQRTFFRVLLRDKQYQEVTVATSPEEALELIEPKRIQFVITAWEMEPISGTALVQRIHSKRQSKHLPCLLFSKKLSENAIRLAKELGIYVLRVPLKAEEVWPVLQDMIKREESLDPLEIKLRVIEASIAEGQFKPALNAIKDCLSTGPHMARAHTLLGETLVNLDQYGKAEKALDVALTEKQNYNPALQLIAKVYTKTERHDKALHMLVQMAENSPENIRTLLNLGATYAEVGEYTKAKLTLDKVKALDPGNKLADDEYGKIAIREGNMDLAHKFLAETENAEELGRFFNNLAVGMVAKGQIQDALRTYEAAINILKDKAKLHFLRYNLGIAYRKLGELDKAFTVLAACYLSEPDYDKAYASLIRTVRDLERRGIKFDKEVARRVQEARRRLKDAS